MLWFTTIGYRFVFAFPEKCEICGSVRIEKAYGVGTVSRVASVKW